MKRRDFLKGVAGGVLIASSAEARPNKEPSPEAVGLLYDATLCIDCQSCMSACKYVNKLPPEVTAQPKPGQPWDTTHDLSSKTVNIIKTYRYGNGEQKDRPHDGYSHVKRQCMHCVDPSCVSACPVSAMTKHPRTGVVNYDAERCIGCRYCVVACPYNVPKYEFELAQGQIRKCELCNQKGLERLDRGQIPVCAEVCPRGATLYGERSALLAEAKRRLALQPGEEYTYPLGNLAAPSRFISQPAAAYQPHIYGESEGGGTQVLYLSAVPFAQIGLPNQPERSNASVSEGVQGAVATLLAPAVAFGGLLLAHRNRTRAPQQDSGSQLPSSVPNDKPAEEL